MKYPLKPSGPGALSAGICLTILLISSIVKGLDSYLRLLLDWTSWLKLYSMSGLVVHPILCLYSSRSRAAFSLWSHRSSIFSFKGSDGIYPVSIGCSIMKKICTFISKFSPSNSVSFLTIIFLVLKELEDVVLQNLPKIEFLKKKRPLFL